MQELKCFYITTNTHINLLYALWHLHFIGEHMALSGKSLTEKRHQSGSDGMRNPNQVFMTLPQLTWWRRWQEMINSIRVSAGKNPQIQLIETAMKLVFTCFMVLVTWGISTFLPIDYVNHGTISFWGKPWCQDKFNPTCGNTGWPCTLTEMHCTGY